MDIFITNRHLAKDEEEYLDIIEKTSKKVKAIILREKDLTDLDFEKLYLKVKERIDKNCILIINSNIYVAEKYNEEYLHLPFEKFIYYKNPYKKKIGVSVHRIDEGEIANDLGATYILASNIYETKCKKGKKGMGLDFIRELKRNVSCKIIALGGINDSNLREVIEAGADGCAVMSYYYSGQLTIDS